MRGGGSGYRSGAELNDERTDLYHDYSRRRDIDSRIQAPEDATPWVSDRQSLWNRVEAPERRHDSQVAREINNDDLARRTWERSHPVGEFKLRSSVISADYFDKYLFESVPALVREVCEAQSARVPADADLLAGLELGGVPLVAVLSQETGLPAAVVRKCPRSYGTRRLAEGADVEGRRLLVVEDVIRSGVRALKSCEALRQRGVEILRVLCVVGREEGGAPALAAAGLELRALFTSADLARAAGQARQ